MIRGVKRPGFEFEVIKEFLAVDVVILVYRYFDFNILHIKIVLLP